MDLTSHRVVSDSGGLPYQRSGVFGPPTVDSQGVVGRPICSAGAINLSINVVYVRIFMQLVDLTHLHRSFVRMIQRLRFV